MALFAIADLHLANSVNKPMDIFGDSWTNHAERIERNWREVVSPADTVLIPGDISWAMTLDQAKADTEWIGRLPGQKVMIRGNHDYWWSGISKVRSLLCSNTYAVQNDSLEMGGYSIAGTRGWLLPNHPNFGAEDGKIYQRELGRLRLSLETASKRNLPIICMLHYPPLSPDHTHSEFTELLEEFGVTQCLYGHLHGASHRFAVNGTINQVLYRLVSADYIQFCPVRLD